MKAWVGKALALLAASLEPPRHELNELDWKAALSPDKKRLTEHLSALANYPGGGYLVFGVDNSGIPLGINEDTVEKVVTQLANLGRAGLQPPLALDHAVEEFNGVRLLFVHAPESTVKPVHLRGKSIVGWASVSLPTVYRRCTNQRQRQPNAEIRPRQGTWKPILLYGGHL